METKRNFLVINVLCLFFAVACAAGRQQKTASGDQELQHLVALMTGSFSSQAQSQRDSDFLDIRLQICPIWASDTKNHWLYVEQATASALHKPYRQRIYKVEKNGGREFKSIVFTLPTPEKWVGGHKNPAIFDQLKPDELSLREGCTVFLTKYKKGFFAGATQGEGCESNLRGAKYATSKVVVTPAMLQSWDQGFDASGKQVWGATKGGYEFVKLNGF